MRKNPLTVSKAAKRRVNERYALIEAEAKAFRPHRRNFTPLRIRAMYVGLAAGRVLVCQTL